MAEKEHLSSEMQDDPAEGKIASEPTSAEAWWLLRGAPSWLASMIVHMSLLIALALITLPLGGPPPPAELLVSSGDAVDTLDELSPEIFQQPGLEVMSDAAIAVGTPVEQDDIHVSPVEDVSSAAVAVELDELGIDKLPRNDLLATVGALSGDALSGRGEQARKGLVAAAGGTAGSERAVAEALKWLAAHQMADGGWSFAHHTSPQCRGQCGNPGMMKGARMAATGLAILPFLGAGKTHHEGEYQRTVQQGLYFLLNEQDRKTGSLYDPVGQMYSHGIAAIALCEAYAMTQDRSLFEPAQKAIAFTCYAQDPVGGGWRYEPHQPGDTSVLGWQLMALKSGHMAYLHVPAGVIKRSIAFLNSVQADDGAKYGYVGPGDGPATTAIGLLCRMYLGWRRDEPALEQGVEWLSTQGPAVDNLYYNYYATQVLHHWEGDLWTRWNNVLRDRLVASQARNGHERGSWYMPDDRHERFGGRLYCTSMATMILEVYYRHLPIYAQQSTEFDFPIE